MIPRAKNCVCVSFRSERIAGTLSPLLDSKDDEIVHEAILALAAIGPASAPASGQLLTILKESVRNQDEVETRLHYAAAYCLGRVS